MAENMREIKRRIKSVESTGHLTNAMRLVSAARFRKARARFERCDRALMQVERALLTLPGLAERRVDAVTTEKVLYIVITSNKGLCGGYNTGIYKALLAAMEAEELDKARATAGAWGTSGVRTTAGVRATAGAWGTAPARRERVEICAIGTKGRDFFARLGYTIYGEYDGDPEDFGMEEARAVSGSAVQRYLRGELARVVLVQTTYVNSLHQEPLLKQLLPPVREAEAAGRPEAVNEAGASSEAGASGASTMVNTPGPDGAPRPANATGMAAGAPETANGAGATSDAGATDASAMANTPGLDGAPRSANATGMADMSPMASRLRKELEMIPSARAVTERLLPLYAALALRRAVIESTVCEHAARRSAMENASNNADDMLKNLSLIYNRARQQAITNELIEIVAGAEAQH